MEQRKFVDLTDDPSGFDDSADQACRGSSLNVFDWTADLEQSAATGEELLNVMDVLPELRNALVQRKDTTRGSESRGGSVYPSRAIPRPRPLIAASKKERQVPVPLEKLDIRSKPTAVSINHTTRSQVFDQPRMKELQNDYQRSPSCQGTQPRKEKEHVGPTVAEYVSRNKRLKRQDCSGNCYAIPPYGSRNDSQRFETNRKTLDRDLLRRSRELDALKKELEEKIRHVDSHKRSLESREKNVKTKSRHIELSKAELEERSSLFVHSVNVSLERISIERKEHEEFCKQKASEIEHMRAAFQNDMKMQIKGLNAKLELFEEDMTWRTQQLDNDREQLESFALAKTKELEALEKAQYLLQKDVEDRLSMCVSGEKQLADDIRDFNDFRAAKVAENEALAKQLQEKQDDLKHKVDCHEEEVRAWAVMKLKQQEDLESRINEFEALRRSQQSTFIVQTEAHNQVQRELDSREAALNKRSRELRARRKELAGSKMNGLSGQKVDDVDQNHSKPIDYILIDSDDEERPAEKTSEARSRNVPEQCKDSIGSAPQKRRKTANDPYRFNYEENYNYSFSEETAFELQERLFREAAEKMRTRASFQVASASNTSVASISSPILDIAHRHPDHWKWRDPYAVLGLPPQTPMNLVKSQYRRLAKTYHPDKSGDPNTSAKFHAISSAYHKLVEKSCR